MSFLQPARKAAALAAWALASDARAHVKWFAPYDITAAPLSIEQVLNAQFIGLFLASVVFVYAFFWLDRWIYRRKLLADLLRRYAHDHEQSQRILRLAAAIFLAALCAYGLLDQPFLLTPELKTSLAFVPWLQLALALCALHPVTAPVTGAGILALYGLVIAEYGLFHALDYLIFLGTAWFLLAGRATTQGWLQSRYVALFAATGLTLLWASIEKWAYPHWTYPMLERDPGLLMGLSPESYMRLAGFVEFNVTFILLSSASLFSRIIALGLGSVFVLAIYKFGLIDAVGHLLIITILAILVLQGPTRARYFLVLADKSLWTEAYFMTGLYVLAFVLIFLAYYGIQFLAYGAV